MNILVTGVTGFTGLHLVRALLSEGHDVTVLAVERTPVASELGYEPRVGLREGLARTAEWYREQGLLDPRSGGRRSRALEAAR
jgi:nucleoside-diphosphate-sugar epimerase